jgi:hypothetical protein
MLALIHFKNAIGFQKKEDSYPEYRMNDQQLYNAHLFLANCGLFIARKAQEDLAELDLKVNVRDIPKYKMSPFFQVINENEQYLANHAYQMVSEDGSYFCSKEECEEQLDIDSMIIVDLSGRQDLLVFNGRQMRLSKNQSELLRFFLVHSNEEHPATINDVFDLFCPADEVAEIPRNTYTQNVRRLVEKLVQVGIEETIIENKARFGVTAYYYNHKLPYLIMHRSDETFILTK